VLRWGKSYGQNKSLMHIFVQGWHMRVDAAAERDEHVSIHELSFHELHEQITYGPNMELIHPRIAKLWAKEKCDGRTDADAVAKSEEYVSFHDQIILSK
jgi:hypothetical protein